MVVMGTLIGAAFYFFGQCEGFPLIGHVEGWKVALAFVMGCLMIPCGSGMDIRGWGEMNSFNGPNWSLTWEYLANILYALVFRHLSKLALGMLMCIAAFCTLDITLNWNIFGLLDASRTAQMYTVIGGWSLTPEQIYIGLTRLMFPFLCGLMLSRVGKFIKLRSAFALCSLIIVVALAMPSVGGHTPTIYNGVYNAFCILLLFPLIVAIGAGSELRGERTTKLCRLLGEISYPLYITHYPLAYVQMQWAWTHPDAPTYAHVMVSVAVALLALGIAYASLKLYDIPVRKWLTDKWLKRVRS